MQRRIANVASLPLPLADQYNYRYTRSNEHSIFQQIRKTDVNTNQQQRPAKINILPKIMEDTERARHDAALVTRDCRWTFM